MLRLGRALTQEYRCNTPKERLTLVARVVVIMAQYSHDFTEIKLLYG